MSWFNLFGLIFMVVILIPNIIFGIMHPEVFENKYSSKTVEALEQVGRFCCFGFMFISPPFVCLGYPFDGAQTVYIILGAALTALYTIGWAVFWHESSVRKALALSILPSLLFLESGILTLHIPLIIFSVIFAICHITISYKNAVL